MPITKLSILKKAAEVVEIDSRLALISDLQAAFFGNEDHVKNLQNIKTQIEGPVLIMEADPNWEEKLKKWAR